MCSMYEAPIKMYKKVQECNKMTVVVNAKTKLHQCNNLSLYFTYISLFLVTQLALTSDEAGKNILKLISSEGLIENQSFVLYRNDFYLHYPAKVTSLIAFGT